VSREDRTAVSSWGPAAGRRDRWSPRPARSRGERRRQEEEADLAVRPPPVEVECAARAGRDGSGTHEGSRSTSSPDRRSFAGRPSRDHPLGPPARWNHLRAAAALQDLGDAVRSAMLGVRQDAPTRAGAGRAPRVHGGRARRHPIGFGRRRLARPLAPERQREGRRACPRATRSAPARPGDGPSAAVLRQGRAPGPPQRLLSLA
jgi:hypothetical protein